MGHSQGGIVAARLAERLGESDEFSVRTVVTAGSPVDHIEVPEDIALVSLVNVYDIVPRLDGQTYGDRSNDTTIVVEEQRGSVGDNHHMARVYTPVGKRLADSTDAEVLAALAPLERFFPGPGDGKETPSFTWNVEMRRG